MKPKVALIRGKFLNAYEMQIFSPLTESYDITAFGSCAPFHEHFDFPVVKLPSPMDLGEFSYKMPVLNRLFIDAHYLLGLERCLRGFDVAHSAETYYHFTQQALAAKRRGFVKKVVATVLENIPHNNEGIWGRKMFKQRARDELDHIIALTRLTKEALLAEGAEEKKITIIGHGIDTRIFRPDNSHWDRVGRSTRNTIRVGFAGRVETYKGVFDVLEAAHLLIQERTGKYHFQFIFIGSGSELHAMENEERQLGVDAFVTHKKLSYQEMPDAYKEIDIFVAPSVSTPTWMEQYCTALLEAQSMGLPIITTRSGGIPENVGNNCLYVPENDPESISHAIMRYVDHPRLRIEMAKKARYRAEKVHDVHIIANKIRDVYESIL